MDSRPFIKPLLYTLFFCLLIWSSGFFGARGWGAETGFRICRADTGQKAEEKKIDPRIIRRAGDSLWRLKRAIQRDAYPSARAALNIWRSNAIEAGKFDEEKYGEFRRQIFEKAIRMALDWFDRSLEQEWVNDAHYAVRIYKFHSNTLETFDPALYNEMLERIKKKKAEIAAREKAEKAKKAEAAPSR